MANLNDIAAGLGHGISTGIRDVAAINAIGNANEEMEMKKGLYTERLKEIERARNMQNEILQHVSDFETKANAIKAKQTSKIATAQQAGAIANPELARDEMDPAFQEYLTKYNVKDYGKPESFYDYKGAFKAGVVPVKWADLPEADRAKDIAQGRNIPPDAYMWPDAHKLPGHEVPPEMQAGDVAANPMAADSEMGLSIKDVLAVKDPKQQAALGQTWLKQNIQNIQPSESNLDLMQLKGDLYERLETTMMKYGDVKDALAVKNQRFQNLAQIAAVSPKAFLNVWNSQYAGRYGGPLTEADITEKGKNIEIKMDDGRLAVIDKAKITKGEPGAIQFVKMPDEGGSTKITGHITVDDKGQPVYADKYGRPTGARAYVKPEKGEKPTMRDVKDAHSMWMNDLKTRIMVDATPENKAELNNMTPEAMISAILSGGLKSLPAGKKAAYLKEIQETSQYFQDWSNKVLGRKIGGNVKLNKTETKVEGKPPDAAQYPPSKNKGRTLIDDETDTKWISDGTEWNKVAK